MADFRTHVTTSTVLGVAYCGVGYGFLNMSAPSSLLAGGLCGIAGMLPDLDSEPGVPLKESVGFAAAVVPMLLVHRFQAWGWPPEIIVLAGAAIYFSIRFGLYRLLQWYTVHRGMFHSLPAALIAAELAFLLCTGASEKIRLYKAVAVFLGYMSHLVLDEFFSVEFTRGRWQVKKSFGSAIKLFGDSFGPNIATYMKLAVLSYFCFLDPEWMRSFRASTYGDAEVAAEDDRGFDFFSPLRGEEEGRAEGGRARTSRTARSRDTRDYGGASRARGDYDDGYRRSAREDYRTRRATVDPRDDQSLYDEEYSSPRRPTESSRDPAGRSRSSRDRYERDRP